MNSARIISLPVYEGNDGSLAVAEYGTSLPFMAKRMFSIYGVSAGESRGNHANRKTEMLMIATSGSVEVEVDDGQTKEGFMLDSPAKALFLPKMTWKTMRNFSDDCVLVVLASEIYDKSEYIERYEDFKKEVA